MKYLNKTLFRQLDIPKIVVIFVLQVLGVASTWGYSEILGFRIGYDPYWAAVAILFMILSAARLCISNVTKIQKLPFVASVIDPATALRDWDSLSMASIAGVLFAMVMDFVLQVLGTASVWAYSEIIGERSTPKENEKWGRVTMALSAISLVRYILRLKRSFEKLDFVTNIYIPKGCYQYFESGLVASYANKKRIAVHFKKYFRLRIHPESVLVPTTAIRSDFEPDSVSNPMVLEEKPPVEEVVRHVSTLSSKLSLKKIGELLCFFLGLCLHWLLTFVLEVMGAGGAVWGSAEFLGLRKTPTSPLFRTLACAMSVFVIFKTSLDYYKKHIRRSGAEEETVIRDEDGVKNILLSGELNIPRTDL